MKCHRYYLLFFLLFASEMVFAERVDEQERFECGIHKEYDSIQPLADKNISAAFWSESKLNEALSLIQMYQKSKERTKPANSKFRETNVKSLKKLDNCLTGIFNTALRREKKALSTSLIESKRIEIENRLAHRVLNLQRVTDSLIRVSESLRALGLQQKRIWLLNTSRRLAMDMLIDIDELVIYSSLYSPLSESTDKKTTFLATYYGIVNQRQLNDYLSVQRQRLFFIATNYAESVIMFLIQTQDAEFESLQVVEKWTSTLKQIEGYKLNVSGNQLDMLEMAFAQLLKKAEGAGCHDSIKKDSNIEKNIFSNIKNKLLEYKTQFCIEQIQ